MVPICPGMAALAVAVIFYAWRSWHQVQERRGRQLRDRVTYMLWVMANENEEETVAVS